MSYLLYYLPCELITSSSDVFCRVCKRIYDGKKAKFPNLAENNSLIWRKLTFVFIEKCTRIFLSTYSVLI
jgi:hypothetical protein